MIDSEGDMRGTRGDAGQIATPDDRFRHMVDAIEDYAIFVLDPDGRVMSWNAGAERIKGYRATEIVGQPLTRFYPPEAVKRGEPHANLARAAADGRFEDEGWRIRKDGSRFWANVVITALRDARGRLTGFVKVTRDLTERKTAEEQLRQSEQRLRLLMDAVDDAIFMLDPYGFVTSWNAGAVRLGIIDPATLGRIHFSRCYTVEDIAARRPQTDLTEAAANGRTEYEGWVVRNDGSKIWAHVVISAVAGSVGELYGFARVVRDMTEREQLRELEHVSDLAAHLEAAREDEKRRIARELHDDLGQQLTALHMDIDHVLGGLEDGVTTGGAIRHYVEGMRSAVQRAVQSVRRLAAGLRPTILDDLGLVPALEWLVDDFRRRSGLNVAISVEADDVPFSDTASTAMFRIVQEGLTNIARHAQGVSTVWVDLRCAKGECCLTIRDDGAIDASAREAAADRPRSAGIAGIRERVRRFGGTATIGPLPERGFGIEVCLPMQTVKSDDTQRQ